MLKANDVFCSKCGIWMREPTDEDRARGRDTAHFCEHECAAAFYANLELSNEAAKSERRHAMKGRIICIQ
jgi:hypothetical protein